MAETVYCVKFRSGQKSMRVCPFVLQKITFGMFYPPIKAGYRVGKNLRSIEGKTFKPKLQKEESIKSRLWRRTRSNRGVLEITRNPLCWRILFFPGAGVQFPPSRGSIHIRAVWNSNVIPEQLVSFFQIEIFGLPDDLSGSPKNCC